MKPSASETHFVIEGDDCALLDSDAFADSNLDRVQPFVNRVILVPKYFE